MSPGNIIAVPDVGEAEQIEVVEILIRVGDTVEKDQSLLVLESDKASVEIPSPAAGVIKQFFVDIGAIVDEGDKLLELQASLGEGDVPEIERPSISPDATTTATVVEDTVAPSLVTQSSSEKIVDSSSEEIVVSLCMPDMGEVESAEVTEVLCALGQLVQADQVLLVVETDKASVEIPSPCAGVIERILTSEQQSVVSDELLIEIRAQAGSRTSPETILSADSANQLKPVAVSKAVAPVEVPAQTVNQAVKKPAAAVRSTLEAETASSASLVHAGPAVRKLAREFGLNLVQVAGSGRRGRILKEDVQLFVKTSFSMGTPQSQMPENRPLPDFSKSGPVTKVTLPRIRQVSAKNLQRNWQTIPHVTHFDEADITELEELRKLTNQEQSEDNVKLTLLAFLVKACTTALQAYPRFNSSIEPDYQHWLEKHFYNIGIAVETDAGLVVPNIKQTDQKSLFEIASEAASLAGQARQRKLSPLDMQGSTFTISSLGGIGGTSFTPIINGHEVAILGVAKAQIKPVYDGDRFVPRLYLPLALSYDHRAIDGAEAARFLVHLGGLLGDTGNFTG
jgi:pyruvate dehydrogenase E2 component (dihydrolipoamide acetyltransferase)